MGSIYGQVVDLEPRDGEGDTVVDLGLACGAEATPRSITAVMLVASSISVFATKEIRFGTTNVHHLQVGCSGESAIYPKSYDRL